MNKVFGLFHKNESLTGPLKLLASAGFIEERISVLHTENEVRRLLHCSWCPVTRYGGWGALTGISIYGIFASVAGFCECRLFGYEPVYAAGTLIAGILIGALIGGLIGAFIGADQSEKAVHLYTQGVRLGGKLVVVQATQDQIPLAQAVLKQADAHGVCTAQEVDLAQTPIQI